QERPYATAYWPFSVRESCTSNANPPASVLSAFGQKGGYSAFEQTNRSILLTILPSETIFSSLKFDAGRVSDGMDVVESCWLWANLPRSVYFAISLFQELKNVY
ncbi:hypothetical protein, partial [Neisseria meningitidis]